MIKLTSRVFLLGLALFLAQRAVGARDRVITAACDALGGDD